MLIFLLNLAIFIGNNAALASWTHWGRRQPVNLHTFIASHLQNSVAVYAGELIEVS
jgi:hypothetical protein